MYLFYFILAAILSLSITPLVKRLAIRIGCVDVPNHPRKIHEKPMPMLGGLAVFIAFACAVLAYVIFGHPDWSLVPLRYFWGVLGGGLVLMIGGALDDRYALRARYSVIFPVVATTLVVLAGVGSNIGYITNPLGGTFNLQFPILGIPASIIFVWVWIMGMVYTTKILDGLDGLASGISLIGGLTLFFLSLTAKVNQPTTATLAIIFVGALAGYLVYAFNPASIFLGESGSTFLGFLLGVLSVLSGAKIATALLVMGIPILDVAWAITRRVLSGRSPFSADRQHLHFRLLDIGFSQRQTVLLLYGLSAAFGFTAVFLQSLGKLIALIILFFVTIGLIMALVLAYKRHMRQKSVPVDQNHPS